MFIILEISDGLQGKIDVRFIGSGVWTWPVRYKFMFVVLEISDWCKIGVRFNATLSVSVVVWPAGYKIGFVCL